VVIFRRIPKNSLKKAKLEVNISAKFAEVLQIFESNRLRKKAVSLTMNAKTILPLMVKLYFVHTSFFYCYYRSALRQLN